MYNLKERFILANSFSSFSPTGRFKSIDGKIEGPGMEDSYCHPEGLYSEREGPSHGEIY